MISEFIKGFFNLHLCWALALADLKQFFHRAFLGMFWVTLSFFLFIMVKNFIFGSFSNIDEDVFVMWVAIGYAVWVFISTSIVEGAMLFIRARSWILSLKTPASVFVFQSLIKLAVFLILNLLACLVIGVMYKFPLRLQSIYALPGLIILFVNHAVWQTILGYFAAKYRDIVHFLQAIMRVLFFLTPILYLPSQIGDKAVFLQYNPFTHFLAIIRDPIIFGSVPSLSWIVVLGVTAVGLVGSLLVVKYKFKNLSLWV